MKSRTSFSKLTPFKKDLTRYAPLWVLYIVFSLLVMMVASVSSNTERFVYATTENLIKTYTVINLIYACICGMVLFSDLFNTRLCYALHAMPMRREGWLVSHLAAGMLFSLVPNLLSCGIIMLQLGGYWFLALYWLLAVTLQFLFFFGIATLSALLTGRRFATLAFYTIFNFVAILAYGTVSVLYLPMLNGVVIQADHFTIFSPVVYLFTFDYFQFTPISGHYSYSGLGTGWGYLAIVAALGLAAMGISLWLYRKRKLETAGDFIAFPKLQSVACFILTICITLCFAMLGMVFTRDYVIWMAIGLVVGFFGSLMMLERRVKVFRKKAFLGFAILVAVVVLSQVAVGGDWFGIESWTPQANKVESVTVANYNPYTKTYVSGNDFLVELTSEADITQIVNAHEDILDRTSETPQKTHRVVLIYKMKSGRTVMRSYVAPASGTNYSIVQRYLYRSENALGFRDLSQIKEILHMYSHIGTIPAALQKQLLEALRTDLVNGTVIPGGDGEEFVNYALYSQDGDYTERTVALTANANHTLALLKSPEYLMGYSDWDTFLERVQTVAVSNSVTDIPPELLLEAMRKDILAGNLEYGNFPEEYLALVSYGFYDETMGDKFHIGRDFCITASATNTLAILRQYGYVK